MSSGSFGVVREPTQTYRRVDAEEKGPYRIPLPGGQYVVLTGTFPLTHRSWAAFLNVLSVMEDGLRDEPVEQAPGDPAPLDHG